jgi:hypothetical protein
MGSFRPPASPEFYFPQEPIYITRPENHLPPIRPPNPTHHRSKVHVVRSWGGVPLLSSPPMEQSEYGEWGGQIRCRCRSFRRGRKIPWRTGLCVPMIPSSMATRSSVPTGVTVIQDMWWIIVIPEHGFTPTGFMCRLWWHTWLRAGQDMWRVIVIREHGFEPSRWNDGWLSLLITASGRAGYVTGVHRPRLRLYAYRFYMSSLLAHKASSRTGQVTMIFISNHGFEPSRSSDGWCSSPITVSSQAG